MKTHSRTPQSHSQKTDSTFLTKFLVILGVFGVTTFVTYGAVSTPESAFMSSPYMTRSASGDLVLSGATNGQGAAILDGYVAKILSGATAQGGTVAYNAYLNKRLADLDALDTELQGKRDSSGKLIYGTDYVFIFNYIYPRLYEQLRFDQTGSVINQIKSKLGFGDSVNSDDIDTRPIPAAPAVTANDTTNTVIGWNELTMESSISSDGGKNYGAFTGATQDLSDNKMLKVRLKATNTALASLITVLTFTKNPTTPVASAPEMPTISTGSTNTTYTISWTSLPNLQYWTAIDAGMDAGGNNNSNSSWAIPLQDFQPGTTHIAGVRACNAGTTKCSDWKTVTITAPAPVAVADCLVNSNGLTIARDKSCVAPYNVGNIHGGSGSETVTIGSGLTTFNIDQNVEYINFDSGKEDYVAMQGGNTLYIRKKGTDYSVASIILKSNQPLITTYIRFGSPNNTPFGAYISAGGVMKIGNQVIPTDGSTVITGEAPVVAATPAPTVSITSNGVAIANGGTITATSNGSVQLTWSSTNATSCFVDNPPNGKFNEFTETSGNKTFTGFTTAEKNTYTFKCLGSGAANPTTITFYVQGVAPVVVTPPPVLSKDITFEVTPSPTLDTAGKIPVSALGVINLKYNFSAYYSECLIQGYRTIYQQGGIAGFKVQPGDGVKTYIVPADEPIVKMLCYPASGGGATPDSTKKIEFSIIPTSSSAGSQGSPTAPAIAVKNVDGTSLVNGEIGFINNFTITVNLSQIDSYELKDKDVIYMSGGTAVRYTGATSTASPSKFGIPVGNHELYTRGCKNNVCGDWSTTPLIFTVTDTQPAVTDTLITLIHAQQKIFGVTVGSSEKSEANDKAHAAAYLQATQAANKLVAEGKVDRDGVIYQVAYAAVGSRTPTADELAATRKFFDEHTGY